MLLHRGVEALESRTYLSAGPRILWSMLRDGGEYVSPGWFTFAFDRPVRPVGVEDCVVRSVDNPAATYPVSEVTSEYDGTHHSVVLESGLPPGRYTLTLLSGDGRVEGTDGADLDGELPASRQLPSGDGVAGGDFTAAFSVIAYGGAPPSPKGLTATPLSDREIELEWFDDTTYEYSFLVERAEGEGDFVQIASYINGTDRNPAHYVDTTAQSGRTYRYRVRAEAYNDSGPVRSAYSNEVVAQVLPEDLTLPVTGLAAVLGAAPDWLTHVNGTVYFTWSAPQPANAWQPNAGSQLWKTDGTPQGTTRLYSGQVGSLIEFGGKLFFAG